MDEARSAEVARPNPVALALGDLELGRIRATPGHMHHDVGAGTGLGEPEAAEPLTRAELRQQLLLLLLGAPLLDRAGDERGLHRDHRASGGVAAPDLFDDQPVREVVEAAAAVLLGHDRPEEPHVGDLLDQIEIEPLVAVVVARHRDDLPVGEVARRLADQALLIGQFEVDQDAASYIRPIRRVRAAHRVLEV